MFEGTGGDDFLDREAPGHIAECYCGDFRQAFREGCSKSREICAARMPRRAEIVLIDSYPADRDFWQFAKGLYAATMAVKDGGTIILVSPNPEGMASNHKNVLEIGHRKHAELVAMVQRGEVEDLVGVAILADAAQIIEKARCIIGSPGGCVTILEATLHLVKTLRSDRSCSWAILKSFMPAIT